MDNAVVALPVRLFPFFSTEKMTKYCDESGNWIQTGSTCQQTLKDKLEVIDHCFVFSLKVIEQDKACISFYMQQTNIFLSQKEIPDFQRDAAAEPTTEAPGVSTEKIILENEKKCQEKMKNDPPYRKPGQYITFISICIIGLQIYE